MKLIPLTQGQFAQVDDSDYVNLNQWKWYAKKDRNTYYAVRHNRGKNRSLIYMHRVIMETSPDQQVDHEDHNGLNCQRDNMRNCTFQQNTFNKIPRSNTGYVGVYMHTGVNAGRIEARIMSNGITIYLGYFHSIIEAAYARDEAAREYHGEFASLNFK